AHAENLVKDEYRRAVVPGHQDRWLDATKRLGQRDGILNRPTTCPPLASTPLAGLTDFCPRETYTIHHLCGYPEMPKNIVVCCDGTGNEVEGNLSNVLKLFRIARRSPDQRVYYGAGIGTIG